MNDKKSPKAKDLLDWLGIREVPHFTKARWVGAGVSFVLTILFLGALFAAAVVLKHTIEQARVLGAEGPNLGAGALIAALLGAPFLIWGTVLKHQTVRYQKEGHMTDRINTAVEQLGAEKTVKIRAKDAKGEDITVEETQPNIEVRIGAILSLERIAQDSTTHDKGRDHVLVMEILCAYVRENSKLQKREEFSHLEVPALNIGPTTAQEAAYLQRVKERFVGDGQPSEIWSWADSLRPPRADVGQALLVIGRRSSEQKKVEAAWPNTRTEDAYWPFVTPRKLLKSQEYSGWLGAILGYRGYRLDLQGANLQGAVLNGYEQPDQGLDFSGALLNNAFLDGANLTFARIVAADLKQTSMLGARLREASFQLSDLTGSKLVCCVTDGLAIDLCAMSGTDFRGSEISLPPLEYAFGDSTVKFLKFAQPTVPDHWKDYEPDPKGTKFREAWKKWRANPAAYMLPPPSPEEDKA